MATSKIQQSVKTFVFTPTLNSTHDFSVENDTGIAVGRILSIIPYGSMNNNLVFMSGNGWGFLTDKNFNRLTSISSDTQVKITYI